MCLHLPANRNVCEVVEKNQVYYFPNYYIGQPLEEQMVCMEGYTDLILNSEKCYYISDDTKTWDDATQACNDTTNWDYDVAYNSQNTRLISIDSVDENDQLANVLGDKSAWIGLSWTGEEIIKRFMKIVIRFELN